jgi:hypothetical protein
LDLLGSGGAAASTGGSTGVATAKPAKAAISREMLMSCIMNIGMGILLECLFGGFGVIDVLKLSTKEMEQSFAGL